MKRVDWTVKVRYPLKDLKRKKNGELIPDDVRCLIIGSSGCGKTTLLIDNFLLGPGWLDKEDRFLYVYSKSLDQVKYKQLIDLFESIKKELNEDIAYFSKDNGNVIPLDECKENSIIIFDDFVLENQNHVRDYFTRGRHKDLDTFYLAQTFSKVPKQLVRDNTNFLCLFRTDMTNLRHVFEEFVGGDLSFDQFVGICNKCWAEDYGFITIDLTRKKHDGKYRNKIKDFLKL